MKKVLDISNSPITLHTNYAMPLSIILTKKQFYYWYLERFIQIIYISNKYGDRSELMYFDRGPAHDEVLEKNTFDLKEFIFINNIKEYVINKLESGFYIKLPVDNFYLSCKVQYKKNHLSKAHLIYGYDLEKEIFYVLAYNKDNVFEKIVINFNELESGYVSKVPDCNIVLFKPLNINYEFNFNIFKQNLSNYLNSKETSNNTLLISSKIKSYGIKANKDFLECLRLLIQDKTTTKYHDFHFFWEHKKLLSERINFIKSKYGNELDLGNIPEEYSDIVKLSNSVRMFYVKTVLEDTENAIIYSPIKNKSVIKELVNEVSDIVDKEEILLGRLLQVI